MTILQDSIEALKLEHPKDAANRNRGKAENHRQRLHPRIGLRIGMVVVQPVQRPFPAKPGQGVGIAEAFERTSLTSEDAMKVRPNQIGAAFDHCVAAAAVLERSTP